MPFSVDAQFLVTTECMSVTSAMRKSSRWVNAGIVAILGAPAAGSSPEPVAGKASDIDEATENSSSNEVPDGEPLLLRNSEARLEPPSPETQLVMDFATTRAQIAGRPPSELSALVISHPFMEVVKSPLVSGHITSLALASLERFLTLGIISPQAKDIRECLSELVYALTHCRFEATDRQEDDAVLLQLMVLLDRVMSGPLGQLLEQKAVHEVIETCMSMAMQMKSGDTLRRSVVATLTSLVRTVFSSPDNAELLSAQSQTFATLVAVLDPSQLQHTNNVRITVLHVLGMCFDVAGLRIGEAAELKENVQNLWKYLAQWVRVTTSSRLVHEALRLVSTIMATTPKPFKMQCQFIVVYLLTSLTPLADLPRDESTNDMFYAGVPNRAKSVKSAPLEPGSNTLSIPTAALQKTPEIREVMVEALATLASASSNLFADLFVTYDCDRASPDLCVDLVGFLCRNAYPDSATWSTASVPPLCLEAVFSGLSSWVEAADLPTTDSEIKTRLKARDGKAVESEVAEVFNNSPSKGIKEMVKTGLIPSDKPADVARFLHTCKRLNKAVLGKYFAKSENKEVLESYVKSFDFGGQRIDEALRTLLCSFRLPGESAQIENLLQKFADHYIGAGGKVEESSDAAFILAYAVLMLNTDHYSPTLKRRMDYEAFKKNVQGVNKNLPDDYVKAIFDGITTQEIVLPEEHDTDETFEHSWREDVVGAQPSEPYFFSTASHDVVKAVFEANWKPIVSTLSFVFATATDDLVFKRVISGFHKLAFLAARFQSQHALTHIVACLSQISALASGDLSYPNNNIEIRIEDHISVIVSDLSTQFGGDLKAQMASITLFRILRVAAKEVSRNAYRLIAKALTNIHIYGLGTPVELDGFKPLPPAHTFERSKAGKPVGIFSALSSYLTSSADTPAEPSDESVDAALGAADCIKVCHIDDTINFLAQKSPHSFAQGVLDVIPQSTDPGYLPAKEFLLRLAGFAASSDLELRGKISKTASDAGLNSVALRLAPKELVDGILAQTEQVNDEILDTILGLEPTQSLWVALKTTENPDVKVWRYITSNSDRVNDSVSLRAVLFLLGKASIDRSGEVVAALEALAQHFRHRTEYLEVLIPLGRLAGSPDGETRENALSALQRELLQEDQEVTWASVVDTVLVPEVLETLLRPEVWKRDPKGMDITRQQAASLIGKVFLHLTVSLNREESEADDRAWITALKTLDRLLSSRRQPVLQETVIEMLKNVILVTKLASRGSKGFWESTQKELQGFLPEVADIVLEDPESVEASKSKKSSVSSDDAGKKENLVNEPSTGATGDKETVDLEATSKDESASNDITTPTGQSAVS